MRRSILFFLITILVTPTATGTPLEVRRNKDAGTLSVFRSGEATPILVQNAKPDFRPYIHPIVAPDGRGVLTQYSPEYNPHQTGLYWGFTSVNGRDYFHHPGGAYWRRISSMILKPKSSATDGSVRWQTVYDLLDEEGEAVLRETQTWTVREEENTYVLDLEWSGTANTDITIGRYDYGGLFLRMPFRQDVKAEAVNSIRLRDQRAEGKRAVWVNVGMQVEGRDDLAHIAIFDHPENPGYPQPWRVDEDLGVGPVRARLGDWKIPKGETTRFQHRLLVYTGEFRNVWVTAGWASYTSDGASVPHADWDLLEMDQFAQWDDADVETVREAYRAKFLKPEEAAAAMTLPDGFEVHVFASEPMIAQPMAFCWDSQGRMWIAQNHDYDGISAELEVSGKSRILILEDTDRDGKADRRTVFLEDIVFPSAMAVGLDGLWLGAIPNVLFVPDRNGDDLADVEDIEVRLTGWGQDDKHEILNSFIWGPDGWLYGLQGVFTHSRVGKPAGESRVYRHGAPYPERFEYVGEPAEINGGVWRYHPVKDRFEVVAHGLSNPWGIDYDAKGQFFASACVIPHLWHVVPGGIYHRQSGRHFNPNVYTPIRTIGDHRHRSAHGGARVYLSDAFPETYYGRLFMGNIHEHAVLTDILERRGSGFVGRHGDDFLLANNAHFIGFSTEIGPEGAVYMLDWHDAEICGDAPRTKHTGRVYRILPSESRAKKWPGRYGDLKTLTNADLVKLQLSASAWHARRARVILQSRAVKGEVDQETHDLLNEIFRTNANGDHRLRALWALHVTDGIDSAGLVEALGDKDEYVRAWAIQLLCEDRSPTEKARARFQAMAKEEPSPVVRLYLASVLQRMGEEYRWPIVGELVRHSEDADDHNIPKILWFGIEPLVAKNPELALKLAARSRIPMVTRHIARRLTAADQLATLSEEIGRNRDARHQLLLGMRDGLEGRYAVKAPKNWPQVYGALRSGDSDPAAIALELSLQFGDATAAKTLVETVRSDESSVEDRRRAIRGLAGRKSPELKPELLALLDNKALRRDAIRAVASFEDDALATTLLNRYAAFSAEEKLEVIHALASREAYGRKLTRAIKRGDVPRQDVPAYIARLLIRVVGNRFLEVWGPVEELSPDTEAAFAKYQKLLSDKALAEADPRRGRALFSQTCSPCHELYGEGGKVGPELTGANRTDLVYLIGNILTPSAVVQEDYKMTMVFTRDGQVYSGLVVGESERRLELRIANVEEPVTIAKSQVVDRELTESSMMPEGLLDALTDREVVDLFAYLRRLEQISTPDAAGR